MYSPRPQIKGAFILFSQKFLFWDPGKAMWILWKATNSLEWPWTSCDVMQYDSDRNPQASPSPMSPDQQHQGGLRLSAVPPLMLPVPAHNPSMCAGPRTWQVLLYPQRHAPSCPLVAPAVWNQHLTTHTNLHPMVSGQSCVTTAESVCFVYKCYSSSLKSKFITEKWGVTEKLKVKKMNPILSLGSILSQIGFSSSF